MASTRIAHYVYAAKVFLRFTQDRTYLLLNISIRLTEDQLLKC